MAMPQQEHIHWHSFPTGPGRREIWYNKIPREKWTMLKYPRLGHKHFLPTDYETKERTNKVDGRKSWET